VKFDFLKTVTSRLYERKTRAFIVFFLYVVACGMIGFLGWFQWWMPDIDKAHVWFQRCGSLITIISLLMELYRQKSVSNLSDEVDFIDSEHRNNTIKETLKDGLAAHCVREADKSEKQNIEKWVTIKTNLYPVVNFVIAALGTVIWGYGDLIYLYYFK
jgi:hypothetical protein